MGDDEENFVVFEFLERVVKMLSCIVIEPGGGLVEDKDGGIGDEGPRQRHTLPLSHAELAAAVEETTKEGVGTVRKRVGHLVGAGKLKGP